MKTKLFNNVLHEENIPEKDLVSLTGGAGGGCSAFISNCNCNIYNPCTVNSCTCNSFCSSNFSGKQTNSFSPLHKCLT